MANKVYITGANMITSLGLDLDSTWKSLKEGKSGVKGITRFDPSELQTHIAAEIPGDFEEYSNRFLTKRNAGKMTFVTKLGFVCASEAVNRAGIRFEDFDPQRLSVILGIVDTGYSSLERARSSEDIILKSMANELCALLSIKYKMEGPCYPISTACSSSAYAIAAGFDLIKNGAADAVIVGGADSIVSPEQVKGFNELYALSVNNNEPTKASRPFSKGRDGFVIGEGAGMLVLESEESARKRGAAVLAEMAGYGLSSEAYNLLSPKRGGEGMAVTMEKALKSAKLSVEEIDYINAHGTSTTLNDDYEVKAVKKVFGERAYQIPVSSSKSMIGHTIGAAGAIEAIITGLSIKEGIVTPTINYDEPDPELDLDFVPHRSRSHSIRAALSNSFAFGGHNATLVLQKV